MLATVAVAASTSPASAETIGSSSLGAPAQTALTCGTYDPCVLIAEEISGAPVRVPAGNWIVTSWRVRNAEGEMALELLQPTGGTSSSLEGNFNAESDLAVAAGGDVVREFATRLPANGGEAIGVGLAAGAQVGGNASGGAVFYEAPASEEFETNLSANYEVLLQVTLEPDADGDGFGDQSQDSCPSQADTQGACPSPPPPPRAAPPPPPPDPLAPLRAGNRPLVRIGGGKVAAPAGTARIQIANPNGFDVKGTLKLTVKGKAIGSRAYAAKAGATVSVKVKLSKTARAALKKRGSLKAKALATVKGPIGKQGSSGGTLTITRRKPKQPAPPKAPSGTRFTGKTANSTVEFGFDLVGDSMRDFSGGINVTCFYPGGTSRSAVEAFDPAGPFPLGSKSEQTVEDKESAILGSRTSKRYTVDAHATGANTVAGTIQISYGFTTFNPITGFAEGSSCVGEDTFTASRG